MRSGHRALPAILIAFLALAVCAASGSAAPSGTRAARAVSYTDPVGDATGDAPDLQAIAFEDDPAGTITIEVTAVGYSTAPGRLHPQVRVYLDTDGDASTGDRRDAGSEYRLIVERAPRGPGVWNLARWDGDAWQMVTPSSTTERRNGDVVRWTVSEDDIGVTTGFRFFAASHVFTGAEPSGTDTAPEGVETWTYALGARSVTHATRRIRETSDVQAPEVERFDVDHAILGCALSPTRDVALTFDDGPTALTSDLLAQLERYGAKATFFVIGRNIDAHTQSLADVAAAGDEVGNHSWSHAVLTTLAPAALDQELSETSAAIRSATGLAPWLMRPPEGVRSAAVEASISRHGMIEALWSLDPRDWAASDPGEIARDVLTSVAPGSIVLLHDGHAATLAALPSILDGLRARGLRHMIGDRGCHMVEQKRIHATRGQPQSR